MAIEIVLDGRKPPVWRISGDTLEDFQERLNELGVTFDLLLAESDGVTRFQGSGSRTAVADSGATGGSSLRTAPSVPLGDGGDSVVVPSPPAGAETLPVGEEGDGTQGSPCAECGQPLDLLPNQAKKLYGRDDICSDCGDALR